MKSGGKRDYSASRLRRTGIKKHFTLPAGRHRGIPTPQRSRSHQLPQPLLDILLAYPESRNPSDARGNQTSYLAFWGGSITPCLLAGLCIFKALGNISQSRRELYEPHCIQILIRTPIVMAASRESSIDAVNVQSCVNELSSILRARAPKLFPCNVAPRLFKPFTTISGLCSTAKQRLDAEAIIKSKVLRAEGQQRRTKKEPGMVTEGEEGKEEGNDDCQMDNVVVVTQTDLGSRKFRVTGLKVGLGLLVSSGPGCG